MRKVSVAEPLLDKRTVKKNVHILNIRINNINYYTVHFSMQLIIQFQIIFLYTFFKSFFKLNYYSTFLIKKEE